MNTVEHIVECYFRMVRKCFTMHDVKVLRGNNRQCDLLAVSLLDGAEYHVESSVTHGERWNPTPTSLKGTFDKKFFGVPDKREGPRTDHTRGKTYFDQILKTYEAYGLKPAEIQRVFCCWTVRDKETLAPMLKQVSRSYSARQIQVLSFRDEVLPQLQAIIGTSNYEDEALRTLSLIRQRELQVANKRPNSPHAP